MQQVKPVVIAGELDQSLKGNLHEHSDAADGRDGQEEEPRRDELADKHDKDERHLQPEIVSQLSFVREVCTCVKRSRQHCLTRNAAAPERDAHVSTQREEALRRPTQRHI